MLNIETNKKYEIPKIDALEDQRLYFVLEKSKLSKDADYDFMDSFIIKIVAPDGKSLIIPIEGIFVINDKIDFESTIGGLDHNFFLRFYHEDGRNKLILQPQTSAFLLPGSVSRFDKQILCERIKNGYSFQYQWLESMLMGCQ